MGNLYHRDSAGCTVLPESRPGAGPFHVFLSHNWKHGQSEMRIVKKALREMLPEIKVFLDVDNLKEGKGGGMKVAIHNDCDAVPNGSTRPGSCLHRNEGPWEWGTLKKKDSQYYFVSGRARRWRCCQGGGWRGAAAAGGGGARRDGLRRAAPAAGAQR